MKKVILITLITLPSLVMMGLALLAMPEPIIKLPDAWQFFTAFITFIFHLFTSPVILFAFGAYLFGVSWRYADWKARQDERARLAAKSNARNKTIQRQSKATPPKKIKEKTWRKNKKICEFITPLRDGLFLDWNEIKARVESELGTDYPSSLDTLQDIYNKGKTGFYDHFPETS